MLRFLIALALAALAHAQGVPPQPASNSQVRGRVEGRVLSDAGAPIRKATVRLQGSVIPTPAGQADRVDYLSETDGSGAFFMENVEPGRYSLTAQRSGFLNSNLSATQQSLQSIDLRNGQHVTGLTIKLTPQGLISGRILDEDGDPMERARVTLYRRAYVNGHWEARQANSASSEVDGSFVIGSLTAGKYYVSGQDSQTNLVGQNVRQLPGRPGQLLTYVNTYYPNVLDFSQAVPIDVSAGQEVKGADIRMRKSPVYRIRGKAINGQTGGPATNARYSIAAAQGAPSSNTIGVGTPDGAFSFNNLLPGSYVILAQLTEPVPVIRNAAGVTTAQANTAPPVPLMARVVVNLGAQDLDNLSLQLLPAPDVTGTIRTDGTIQQQSTAPGGPRPRVQPTVRLVLADPVSGLGFNLGNQQSKDDGSFVIHGVGPSIYNVNVQPVPPGTYVKSIRFGGQDVTKTAIDLTSGAGGNLDVLLGTDGADVSGTVHNDNGEPLATAFITLWEPVQPIPGWQGVMRTLRTDSNGGFKFSDLPPGEYRIAAWEDVDITMPQIPEFRVKFESKATTVKLSGNGHETAELKLIKHDASEAEAVKLR